MIVHSISQFQIFTADLPNVMFFIAQLLGTIMVYGAIA